MLKMNNITKTFNSGTVDERVALDHLSLTLRDGDFVTVIGGNGAGKSTMQNAICGTWQPDEGSIELDGGNVSGTSDLAPLTEQADMILELLPETKTVGLLYCSAEPNSEYQVQVVEYLTGKGITCTRYSFSDSNDVAAVTTKAAADSDVIYIPTDNTAASCTETIGSIVLNAKTPVVAGEKGICTGCGSWVWVWRIA